MSIKREFDKLRVRKTINFLDSAFVNKVFESVQRLNLRIFDLI